MNASYKYAYSMLLYYGMLNIRDLCQSRGKSYYNPVKIYRQYRASRLAGGMADWLHNLAYFMAKGYKNFNEDQFWEEYNYLVRRDEKYFNWPGIDFREYFQKQLSLYEIAQQGDAPEPASPAR
jgi:hypothetical protein